jgi:threonine dehydrogenase-like Zn-dependent dehydrogenase
MIANLLKPIVFLGLAAAGIAGAYGGVRVLLIPLDTHGQRVALAQTEFDGLTSRREATLAALAAVPPAISGPDARIDRSGSVADALQSFQEAVRTALAAAGGEPVVSQTGIDKGADSLTTLRLLIKARLTEPALMTFLRQVESATPKIATDSLELRSFAGATGDTLELTATFVMLHSDAV